MLTFLLNFIICGEFLFTDFSGDFFISGYCCLSKKVSLKIKNKKEIDGLFKMIVTVIERLVAAHQITLKESFGEHHSQNK